jgi:hypothetical protein
MIIQKQNITSASPQRIVGLQTDIYGRNYSSFPQGDFTEQVCISSCVFRYYKYQKGSDMLRDFLNDVETLVKQYQSEKLPQKIHTRVEANKKITLYNTKVGFNCILPCENWEKL